MANPLSLTYLSSILSSLSTAKAPRSEWTLHYKPWSVLILAMSHPIPKPTNFIHGSFKIPTRDSGIKSRYNIWVIRHPLLIHRWSKESLLLDHFRKLGHYSKSNPSISWYFCCLTYFCATQSSSVMIICMYFQWSES